MTPDIAGIEFSLEWTGSQAVHKDITFLPRVNFWRDFFPQPLEPLTEKLIADGQVQLDLGPGKLVEPYTTRKTNRISRSRIKRDLVDSTLPLGRFFPRGLLSEIGFAREDLRSFRVINSDAESLQIDTNHPLADIPLTLKATLTDSLPEKHLRGGSSIDIGDRIAGNGPGMQVPCEGGATDFFSGDPFSRVDPSPDHLFYNRPRLLNHVDLIAAQHVSSLYAGFLRQGMTVLDLMASWNSHLPSGCDSEVVGLGMNREELTDNPNLTDSVIHDLNSKPVLPFDDDRFDACICSLSVEYLTRPVEVFREVGRVLKKGAPFIVTFSDRWFEPKVVQIWTELHPFERMGLVISYFTGSERFSNLYTESIRGYLRPETDSHIQERKESDPIFAVWGFKK